MKDKILLLFVFMLIPLITACGKSDKVLSCTKTMYDSYTHTVSFKYNSEKTEIIGIDIKAVIKIRSDKKNNLGCDSDYTDEECLEKLIKDSENSCNNDDSNIENCRISKKSKSGFTFTARVIPDRIPNYLEDLNAKTAKDEMKKIMEERDEDISCE